jgi:hypothetical protein
MATVSLDDRLDPTVRHGIESGSRRLKFTGRKLGVPITLEEPLRIRFSISASWNINRDLLPCRCSIPFGGAKTLGSINSAYQQISEVAEPHRRSRGGTVYDGVYCRPSASGEWQTLGQLREIVYEPYRQKYEDAIQKYKTGTPSLVRAPERFADLLLAHKDDLISILSKNTGNLEGLLRGIGDYYQNTNVSLYRKKIEEFESRLRAPQVDTMDEAAWQDWIYKNNWMFGSQYAAPLPKERVGFSSIPDFLFPTLDGYIDALEIKTPAANILIEDRSHPGSHRWSQEASAAIGQATVYIDEIEKNRATLAERIEERYGVRVSTIRPRALILMGQSDAWRRPELDSFRRLNHALHGIEIISYTSLLRRAKGLVSLFKEELSRD